MQLASTCSNSVSEGLAQNIDCQLRCCLGTLGFLQTAFLAFASDAPFPVSVIFTQVLRWIGFLNFIYKTNLIHKVWKVYVDSTMGSNEHLQQCSEKAYILCVLFIKCGYLATNLEVVSITLYFSYSTNEEKKLDMSPGF